MNLAWHSQDNYGTGRAWMVIQEFEGKMREREKDSDHYDEK
jgi:hypothetical protein